MKTFWGLMMLLVGVEGSLGELGKMIEEELGTFAILDYGDYGCYCGLGGEGRLQDSTDRCCFTHDHCYEYLTTCHPKLNTYKYTRVDRVIHCGEETWCEKQVCKCDRALVICFRENWDTYDEKLKYYKLKPGNC
ncbi:phospholipase A2 homolog 1-like [Candoia aspera]|uniref:phospholipase A2 homolog 1-like n=1 Tax=Candoia aspera TaxID=51853 RepID=UPI002FD814B1